MKMKAVTGLALIIMLSLSISAVFSKNDNFHVDYTFNAVKIDGQWMIENTKIMENPGEPLMPYRTASILLPQGATLKDVKVKHGKPIVQEGFDLPWGQKPATFSGPKPEKVGPDKSIYNSNSWYPNKVFEVVGVNSFRGYDILNVILYPVQYQPKAGKVKFYEKLTVEVQFGNGMKNKLYRGLSTDTQTVSGMVDNQNVISTYDSTDTSTTDSGTLATEEYIIITSSTLETSFQTLANHKASYVNGAYVYTVGWITSNYTGSDNQEKIRNFIIDKYTNNGLKWVLLGGDTGVVPYRGFYISTGGYTDSDMAADMYYAHLDGTFDDDGDGRYAESGEVDWYAEVAVGRAPVDNTTEADAFVNKVIEYEQAAKPKRALLHQSRTDSGNSPDARCLAWNCDDWLPSDYTKDYLFEEDGGVTKQMWIDHWGYNPIVVAHIGHGNTDKYYINYEVSYGSVTWYNSDCSNLTNSFYPWTTSVACISGEFEASDCLAEAYVKASNGAIAAIYNNNYGWYSSNDACHYSGEFCEMEFRACWSDGYEKLGDMLNQARSYMVSDAQNNDTYRWCFYERNLMGDPESPTLTVRAAGDSVTITNPSNGETVSGTVNITTSTSGCIDEVIFYIDGTQVYDDTTSPFEYSWDTTAYADGDHTIKVEGYCSGTFADDDSITVTVDNIVEPYVTITNPSEGETVSGTVTCTADSNCDSVKWYIDGTFQAEDTSSPFEYSWDTTAYSDGSHTVKAEGYNGGVYECEDSNSCTVDNSGGSCLGTTLLTVLILLGAAGIYKKR